MEKGPQNNFEKVINRTKYFNTAAKSGALIQVDDIESIKRLEGYKLPKPLNTYNFNEELYLYLDDCIDRFLFYWDMRQGLEDDLLPAFAPSFGIAEHSAYLGGEVIIEAETSYHKPFIKEWSDTERLKLDINNVWFKRLMDAFDYVNKKSGGRYITKLRGGCSPTELMSYIRGNDIFTDFYEYPEETHNLLEFCLKAEKWFIEKQKEKAGDFYGGYMTGHSVWLEGNSFGHISEDWSVMCSPDTYERYGKPYTKRIIEDYDNVLMHLHSIGTQCLPNIVSLNKLTYIQISSDPNSKRAIEIYKSYSDLLENKTVVIDLTKKEIFDNTDFLREHKSVIKFTAENIEEAKTVIDYVKSHIDC